MDDRRPSNSLRDRLRSLPAQFRMRAGAVVVDNFFRYASRAGKLHPLARPERHGVEVLTDLSYLDTGRVEHRLDIYRPTSGPGPYPVVLYVHGGGFRILSKDTHWIMALPFARQGYMVVTINYRLAPRYPYPAALEDCAAAYLWVARHAVDFGGDLDRFVLAGESAGANLVTALTVAACYDRPEPWARDVAATGLLPKVTWPACGLLQVSDSQRFVRRRPLPIWISDRLREVEEAYLDASPLPPAARELADPLLLLERGLPPDRPLPAFFASVGTKDPLLDDTRRLERALTHLGVPCQAHYYDGEVHAFQALVFRPNARRCWRDTFAFLKTHLGPVEVERPRVVVHGER